jgi:hypothetical protein
VAASYICDDGIAGPGVSTCKGTVPDGQPIDTGTVGVHKFAVVATSKDGEHSTTTTSYTVLPSSAAPPGGAGGSGGSGGPPPPPPPKPDNHFKVSHIKVGPSGKTTFKVTVPGAGTINALETASGRHFVFARAHAVAAGARTVSFRLVPGKRGRSLARHHKHKVPLRLLVTYKPSSGVARSVHLVGLHLPKHV